MRLKQFFGSHIYSGEQVPRGKPSPDIFLHAAKQLDVSPKQCVVIEDSANGAIAGSNAGMEFGGLLVEDMQIQIRLQDYLSQAQQKYLVVSHRFTTIYTTPN